MGWWVTTDLERDQVPPQDEGAGHVVAHAQGLHHGHDARLEEGALAQFSEGWLKRGHAAVAHDVARVDVENARLNALGAQPLD